MGAGEYGLTASPPPPPEADEHTDVVGRPQHEPFDRRHLVPRHGPEAEAPEQDGQDQFGLDRGQTGTLTAARPEPNGMYASLGRLATSSGRNRSGTNFSDSGQWSGFRWTAQNG